LLAVHQVLQKMVTHHAIANHNDFLFIYQNALRYFKYSLNMGIYKWREFDHI